MKPNVFFALGVSFLVCVCVCVFNYVCVYTCVLSSELV